MKAIKERAHKYIEQAIVCGGTGVFSAYIAGAAEQWTIDVEKACKWFADYLMEIGYPDDWMRDSPNMANGKERFIKAMEEEL